ncbi:hypothetical protein EDB89DRAFT_1585543 [Lactarius sanguifluus]|nr:hypothetical protein EDB89DRAFT_1585543 [Lactarius sanguifluus]
MTKKQFSHVLQEQPLARAKENVASGATCDSGAMGVSCHDRTLRSASVLIPSANQDLGSETPLSRCVGLLYPRRRFAVQACAIRAPKRRSVGPGSRRSEGRDGVGTILGCLELIELTLEIPKKSWLQHAEYKAAEVPSKEATFFKTKTFSWADQAQGAA